MNRLLVIPLIVVLLVPMFGIAEANPGAPDLQINNVSVTVSNPAQPNKVHVEITVANRGDAPTGTFVIRWYPHQASNEVGCSIEAAGLSAGKQGKAKCNYTYVGSGQMHWRAVVDEEAEVAESNESNNAQTGAITIGGSTNQPDLVILNPRFEPSPVIKGQDFKAIMTIKNVGSAPVTAQFRALWEFHVGLGIEECVWNVGTDIGPGASVQASCVRKTNSTMVEAPTNITVDAENVIAELDEANNDVTLTLGIGTVASDHPDVSGPKPDLLIKEVHFEPAHPVPGQPFKAVMTVRNDSNVDVTQSFRGLWEFDPAAGVADCKWKFGQGLKAGKEIIIDCERTSNANPAQYSTQPTVDADNVISESDEVNNDKPTTLILYATDAPDVHGPSMPDLTIKNLRVAPAKAIPSQMLTISFDVVNQGTAAPPSKATWYSGVSNQQGHVRDIPALGAGATHHVDIADVPAPSTPGSYSHYAVADSASLVDEENENNNKLVGSENLAVMAEDHPDTQGPADLVIRNLRMTPNPVTHGHDFQVEFEVVNQGQGEAKKSVAEWHTPPGGGLSFRCDVPKLAKGASHKCSWQFMAAPAKKNYGTTATADVDNAVNESNEDNNLLKETLNVK